MGKKIFIVILTSIGLLTGCKMSNEKILNKSISKLNSLNKIEYQEIFHVVQNEAGFDEIDTVISFFDFTSQDTLIGAKYHFVSRRAEQVFDGKKQFFSDNNEERLLYNNEPSKPQLCSSMLMINSIYALKKVLPKLLNDSSIVIDRLSDTLINGENNYLFKITLKDKYISYDTRILDQKGFTENYELVIAEESYLPTQFTNIYSANKGFWKAGFTNFNLSPNRHDSIWEYDRFSKRFMVMSTKEYGESMRAKASLNIGQNSPDWSLPILNGDSQTLSDLRGRLVLLEFWFPYCGGCVRAIPDLNEIQKTYSNKGLKLLGIEFSQSNNKGLDEYVMKQNIAYPILYTGKNVAKEYGISAAPTFFLIDRKGKIVYTSVGFNKDGLIKSIEENI